VTRHLSARARLTLLYSSLFVAGGAALVLTTYELVSRNLPTSPAIAASSTRRAIGQCIQARAQGVSPAEAKGSCAALFASGVRAGATAQRSTTLTHLLIYSLVGLASTALLAIAAGWIAGGRILRPIHQVTAAARSASERDLTQRLDLQGPRDELRELADTFDAMLERLNSAFADQQQFIANASHELRTPLTVMRTSVDVVLAKPEPTQDELVSMAIEIRHAVSHAENLIQALLILARSGQMNSVDETIDLAEVMEDAVAAYPPDGLATTSKLRPAPVVGDSVLLDRLSHNLIDNAHRYNVADGTVFISTDNDERDSILRIINTGPVIPPDQIDRLFQPFTRLVDRTRNDGYGLGLALVTSIAAAHSGTVHATAIPEGGLDITVRLPRTAGGTAEPSDINT
jgi:signal transduction histidine kinase